MDTKRINPEVVTEVVRAHYKSSPWKFFAAFALIVFVGAGFYFVQVSPDGNKAVENSPNENSFFASVGDNTEGTLNRIFSGDSNDLVEVINLNDGTSYSENESPEEQSSEEEVVISKEDDKAEQNIPVSEDVEVKVVLCGFNTNDVLSQTGMILNEVAWMGGESSSNDEWVELKNISSSSINLDGWQIVDQKEQIQAVLSESVASGGFYLLERTDDNSVPSVAANMIYNGALSNTNEGLRLFNANCDLVDEVFADSDWPAGDASLRLTMQREANLTWSTALSATPRAENGDVFVDEPEEGEEDLPLPPEDEPEETPQPEEPASEEESSPSPEEDTQDFSIIQITDVVFDIEGTDSGNERVTILNNGNEVVDLSNFSLQYVSSNGDFSAVKKKNFESGHSIGLGEAFVIGMNCHIATPCDGVSMSWSQALNNTGGSVFVVSNQEKIASEDDTDVVSRYDYIPN